jgi:hypothetical protein
MRWDSYIISETHQLQKQQELDDLQALMQRGKIRASERTREGVVLGERGLDSCSQESVLQTGSSERPGLLRES